MVRRPKKPCRGRESFILGVLIVQLDLDIVDLERKSRTRYRKGHVAVSRLGI